MVCFQCGTKQLPEPMMTLPMRTSRINLNIKFEHKIRRQNFSWEKICLSPNAVTHQHISINSLVQVMACQMTTIFFQEKKFENFVCEVAAILLTHWIWVTSIGSGNGLSPGQCQVIIWTNAGILLIGPSGINFSEISIEIHTFSFKKIHWKMSFGKWRPFYVGLNVIRQQYSQLNANV